MENKVPMSLNKEHYTIMDNKLVAGRQTMTLQEAKITRLAITQVVKQDKDFKTFTVNIGDLAQFLDIPKNNLYRDIRSICEGLLKRLVYIGTDNPREPWKMFQWFSMARYDGQGTITLRLSDQIKPFVIELHQYNKYKLQYILQMQSFYAIRLYELLKIDEFKGNDYQEFTISYLRQFFDCEKKFERISQFKERVIEIAVAEINNKSDIRIKSVEYIKKGRNVDRVKFEIFLAKVNKSKRHGILNQLENMSEKELSELRERELRSAE